MTAKGDIIAAAALQMVGTPFKHQGRNPKLGLDCVGVVLCALWTAGCDLPDCIGYAPLPHPEFLLRELEKRARSITHDEAEPGDVLLFQHRSLDPIHFGVLVHNNCVVHARRGTGKVVKDRLCHPLMMRLHSIWRPEGVDG